MWYKILHGFDPQEVILMGKRSRPKPARLAEKLLQIRRAYDLSQNGMIRKLGLADELVQADVSAFELGTREPALPHLLQYARTVGITVDVLIDDKLDLPGKLAADPKHGVVSPAPSKKKKRTGARQM
jgi:transcriptional regulator with XRE-family HTH domain